MDFWIKANDLLPLKEHLVHNDLYSFEKLRELRLSNNFEQKIKTVALGNLDIEANLEQGINSLLINHLGSTYHFLLQLNQLCEQKRDEKWVLILIDCDDVGVLLHDKKISMKQAQHSINLLNANICKIVAASQSDNTQNSKMLGYHLGGDLFALFIYDNNKNTMNKSVEIVESLLKIMQDKEKSSFTISAGIGIRSVSVTDDHDDCDYKDTNDITSDSIKREWVSRAYTNLLRAKENGKNCYFNIQNDIDSSKDNKELRLLTTKVNDLYDEYSIDECEYLIDTILDKFDQDTIIEQSMTTTKNKEFIRPIYCVKSSIISFRNKHIGNAKYRADSSEKYIQLCIKTFILGNMTVECYYYFKSLQVDIQDRLSSMEQMNSKKEISKETENRLNDPTNHILEKYDLTLLTRKRSADPKVRPEIKGTLYYSKCAFEHLNDTAEAPRIGCTFAHAVVAIDKTKYDYGEKLYRQVIKCDSNYGLGKASFMWHLWKMEKYNQCFDFIDTAIKATPKNTALLFAASQVYIDSCKLHIDKKLEKKNNVDDDDKNSKALTKDERIDKAIEYGQKLIELVNKDGKWIRRGMYLFYGSLLYTWSKDFDKNKKQQRLALKMHEKGIKMDQQFGYDIINNWIRDIDKFEHELVSIIVDYWYYPDRPVQANILDYADLIETYFNQDAEKMRRAKMLTSTMPYGFVRQSGRVRNSKQQNGYLSIKKPAIYDKAKTNRNAAGLYTLIWSWNVDVGGVLTDEMKTEDNNNAYESMNEFTAASAAKLAYFFVFWEDYKDFVMGELQLTTALVNALQVVMICLLTHYGFELQKKEHKNFMAMIKDSTTMTKIITGVAHLITLEKIAIICEKIDRKIDLNAKQVISNMATIISPVIQVTQDYR